MDHTVSFSSLESRNSNVDASLYALAFDDSSKSYQSTLAKLHCITNAYRSKFTEFFLGVFVVEKFL